MAVLPEGAVTFLFTDVEGSTELLEHYGVAMSAALARHHELFDAVVNRHGGAIFETVGDAVYAVFAHPPDAARAALDAQRSLAAEDWGPIGRLAVRIAIHTGHVERRGDHYLGSPLFRTARLQALAHGEQTLVSGTTAGLVGAELPAQASLRDLGTHRLKDLRDPEHVFQLVHPDLRGEFPPLRSLDSHPHNIPDQLSSFIGREVETAEVVARLDAHRLVSLLGPGGIGKTRLALEVATQRLANHPDGIFFVDLSSLRDPELVLLAIATTLGLREQPGQSIASVLSKYARGKRLLLVLDNLEQLLPAAARLIGDLLSAANELRVLATSRIPLRVRGELEYQVPPLATGAAERLDGVAEVLFVDRARAVRPDLVISPAAGPLIADICERLDGLPLAIELAAARLRLFSLTQLHDRLARRLPVLTGGASDLPERQRTLRSAIAWSEGLLNEPERRLFARLAVFAGGFTLDGAESTAGPDLGAEVLDGLGSLLEQSLLSLLPDTAAEPRYTMLETIREYALERLEATGEADAVRQRHGDRLLDFATRAYAAGPGEERKGLYELIESELDDVRAALQWLDETRRSDELLQLVSVLARFWAQRGHISEGRVWVARALEAAPDGDAAARGRIQRSAWSLHHLGGTAAEAYHSLSEAVRSFEAAGAEAEVGSTLALLGDELQSRGHLADARAVLERAVAIAERVGDDVARRRALDGLANLLVLEGDAPAAESALTEVFEWAVESDDAGAVRQTGISLATIRYEIGRVAAAEAPAQAAVDAARKAGLLSGEPFVTLGMVQALQRRYSAARDSLTEAVHLVAKAGDMNTLPALLKAWASLEIRDGDASVGAYCLGAGLSWEVQREFAPTPSEIRFDENETANARNRLTEEEFADGWERGSRATFDELIAMLSERTAVGRSAIEARRGRLSE
ncbi:MAG: ATP-binding protein [Candidatus Limnocylindria bacterium]